jgi:hypothetical protein
MKTSKRVCKTCVYVDPPVCGLDPKIGEISENFTCGKWKGRADFCKWKIDDLEEGSFETACNENFVLSCENGSPRDYGVKFCPFCGGKILVEK